MEISYYFECQSFNPTASLSKCFDIEMVEARFTFDMEFDDDYRDVNSNKSTDLWNQIKPIIMKSFGAVEILLNKLRIFSGSVVIETEINVSRDLVQDIKDTGSISASRPGLRLGTMLRKRLGQLL